MMSTVTNTKVVVKYRRNVGSLSINMSAANLTTTLGRHIDQHIGRVSVYISTEHQPTLDQYVDRQIGRHSADMSTDTSVDYRSIF